MGTGSPLIRVSTVARTPGVGYVGRWKNFGAKIQASRASLNPEAGSPPSLDQVPEAAAIFKVSVATMRRWVKTGHVSVVKLANTVRVDLPRVHGVDAADVARMAREARARR